ncbi:MAG: hypothetical protein AAGJ81_14735 [Verrucomicrobiota bacterium]
MSIGGTISVCQRADESKYWHLFGCPRISIAGSGERRRATIKGFYVDGEQTLARYAKANFSGFQQRNQQSTRFCGPFSDHPGENDFTDIVRNTYSGGHSINLTSGDFEIEEQGTETRFSSSFTCSRGPFTEEFTNGIARPRYDQSTPIPNPNTVAASNSETSVVLGNLYNLDAQGVDTTTSSGAGWTINLAEPMDFNAILEAMEAQEITGFPQSIWTGTNENTDIQRESFPLEKTTAKYGFLCQDLIKNKKYVVRGKIQQAREILDDFGDWEDYEDLEEQFTASGRKELLFAETEEEDPELSDITPTEDLPHEEGFIYRIIDVTIEATHPIQ